MQVSIVSIEAATVLTIPGPGTQQVRFAALAEVGGTASDPTILTVLMRRAARNDWLWTRDEPDLPRQHDSKIQLGGDIWNSSRMRA